MYLGHLRGANGKVYIEFSVGYFEGLFTGEILQLYDCPGVFVRFEELLNDMVFSLLDDIQSEIEDLKMVVTFSDHLHEEYSVLDVQVFPREGSLSFRLVQRG